MWRPCAYRIESVRLCVYRRIIRYYLRYVLVRCAKFTNRRGEAETIAFYTLVTTCLLAPQLRHARQLGIVVDLMVHVVARDQIRQKVKTGQEPKAPTAVTEVLLGNKRMQKLAQAMNMLDGFTRELLVLYHIEMMDVRELSQFFDQPCGQIRAQITEGRRTLAGHLRQLSTNCPQPQPSDVPLLLDEFRAYVDANSTERLGRYALSYVVQWEQENRPKPLSWNLN